VKVVGTLVALIAIAYLLLCAWMALHQRDFIYYPQWTRVDAAETDFALDRADATLRGWRVNPRQRDAIVYFGGNAESIQSMRPHLAAWAPAHTGYLVAYRGYGASDGHPSEAALTDDAVALFDAIRAAHPDGRITVIGRSLGSGVASHLASQRPVAGLVLITPFDNLASVAQAHMPWLPVAGLLRDRFDAARDLANYRGPVLVIRAGRDEVVPAANTRRLIDALPMRPIVVDIPEADHNSIDGDPRFERALVEFLR
jgi:pimeloyl-ACP methyl ester carboxylesterase